MTAQILPLDTTGKCTFVLILVKLIYFLVAIFATKDNFPSYPFVKLTNSSEVVVQYDNHKINIACASLIHYFLSSREPIVNSLSRVLLI